jgi:nicotinamide-nucleotide amidase
MASTAEIIAIGSELLTPHRVDSNSLYLTKQLNSIGIEVGVKVVAGDDEGCLEQVVKVAIGRSSLVIATGGLGPTEDDITKKVFARVLHRQMVLEEQILKDIKSRFLSRGLDMPANNARQALVPVGAQVLENPTGTAPGLWIEEGDCVVILLPGVPSEMKTIFETSCLAVLKQRSGNSRMFSKVLKTTGMAESQLDEKIAPIYTEYRNPVTTILASQGEVQIHLTGRGKTEKEAEILVNELSDKMELVLGEYIFSRGTESLEQIVGYYLLMRQKTLSIAESCTGGLISERMTRVPGSSEYFLCGVTCYSNQSKINLAEIPPLVIEMNGAVSPEVAKSLAEGIREKTGSNLGLGITGIAGPSGGSPEKPVGLVYIALATEATVACQKFQFGGDRERVRFWASQTALDMVRRSLI